MMAFLAAGSEKPLVLPPAQQRAGGRGRRARPFHQRKELWLLWGSSASPSLAASPPASPLPITALLAAHQWLLGKAPIGLWLFNYLIVGGNRLSLGRGGGTRGSRRAGEPWGAPGRGATRGQGHGQLAGAGGHGNPHLQPTCPPFPSNPSPAASFQRIRLLGWVFFPFLSASESFSGQVRFSRPLCLRLSSANKLH